MGFLTASLIPRSSRPAVLAAAALLIPAVPGARADLVISEIMQNPQFQFDSNGEYFELFNPDTAPVDIEGWTIRDEGSNHHVIESGGPLIISPLGFLVLGINEDPDFNGGVPVDYEYSNFTLGNTDDEIVLLDLASNEVDRVEYDGGQEFPDPSGASMELVSPELDNNVGANWAEATTGWPERDPSSDDTGSPGAANEDWEDIGAGDTDGDGMPDLYEILHCGGPTNCVATEDLDLDGYNNLDEYIADTIPTNAASYFSVTVTPAAEGVDVVLEQTSIQRSYVVEFDDDPTASPDWAPLAPAQPGTGGDVVVPDTTGAIDSRAYRGNVWVP